MGSSATKQLIVLLNSHAVQLMQAAQDDWRLAEETLLKRERSPDHRQTHVGRLDAELRPHDPSGPFFTAHDDAVRECASLSQLAAFQPLFERVKFSYWRAWEQARQAFASDERLDWGNAAFGALTRDIAEVQDLLPALDAAAHSTSPSHEVRSDSFETQRKGIQRFDTADVRS